jgi:hypothetical protein
MRPDKATSRKTVPPASKGSGDTSHSVPKRFERAKAVLAQADSFYASESFWKAFAAGGLDEAQVAKLEAMAKSYRGKRPNGQSVASNADDPIGELLDKYDSGEIGTVQDLADEAEALGAETENEGLLKVVRAFRGFQQEDRALAGRGDWDEAEANLISGLKRVRRAASVRDAEGRE